MHRFTLTLVLSFVAGCAGRVGYSAEVSNVGYGPELVYVAPGVQVIADYDEPIFYADNFYWRFDGATWYRSPYYTGGWVYAAPPVAVLRIPRPREYVHYRPQGWGDHRPGSQPRGPIVRDHRDREVPPPRAQPQPPPPPSRRPRDARDHRRP